MKYFWNFYEKNYRNLLSFTLIKVSLMKYIDINYFQKLQHFTSNDFVLHTTETDDKTSYNVIINKFFASEDY